VQADEFRSHHKDDNGERSGKHFPEFAVSLFTQDKTHQVTVIVKDLTIVVVGLAGGDPPAAFGTLSKAMVISELPVRPRASGHSVHCRPPG